ncbi:uncharacterized protein TNCV_5108571 [Trichonephila clavipes]|nr:uncharacterized protein TNCV_5108571 [Trichonephila clavipes]
MRGTTPNEIVDVLASRVAHVMGAAIPKSLQPGAFVWFEKTQRPLMKVLPVPGWRPMKQYACISYDMTVFSMTALLRSTGPNTSTTQSKRPN